MCVPFLPQERQHTTKFEPHPSLGQSREVVYVYGFLSPLKNVWSQSLYTENSLPLNENSRRVAFQGLFFFVIWHYVQDVRKVTFLVVLESTSYRGVAAEIYFQISCQSRFSGVYLVFEVLQESEFKERLATSYLVLQACILFSRCFRQEWRISVLPYSRKKLCCSYGFKFYIPPPPTPENSLLQLEGCIQEGRMYQIPAAGLRCTRLRVPPVVALHVSRYTCRS